MARLEHVEIKGDTKGREPYTVHQVAIDMPRMTIEDIREIVIAIS